MAITPADRLACTAPRRRKSEKNPMPALPVRSPAVAGTFYRAMRRAAPGTLDEFFALVPEVGDPRPVRAVIPAPATSRADRRLLVQAAHRPAGPARIFLLRPAHFLPVGRGLGGLARLPPRSARCRSTARTVAAMLAEQPACTCAIRAPTSRTRSRSCCRFTAAPPRRAAHRADALRRRRSRRGGVTSTPACSRTTWSWWLGPQPYHDYATARRSARAF
jgi:hypothetical protein